MRTKDLRDEPAKPWVARDDARWLEGNHAGARTTIHPATSATTVEDAYSAFISTTDPASCPPGTTPAKGWDGAPLWATLTDGLSTCLQGSDRNSSPAVERAWNNFYDNTDGIRDRFVTSWAAVATEPDTLATARRYAADEDDPPLGRGLVAVAPVLRRPALGPVVRIRGGQPLRPVAEAGSNTFASTPASVLGIVGLSTIGQARTQTSTRIARVRREER